MLLNIVFILGGFMLLIKGADYLVDGSSAIARRFGISTLVIGLTVVAFGTSAPELAVSLLAATVGSTDLAVGNINGSNIANILLILGIVALFAKVPVRHRTVIKEIPFMILAGVVLLISLLDVHLTGAAQATVSRIDGMLFLCFFIIFMYYLFLSAKETSAAKVDKPKFGLPTAIGFTVLGLVGLVIGGKLAVDGAVGIAVAIGISEALVGLTIVAIGTSLPELVSAVVAARKGETDLAIGNVVGSNVFNILLVLGLTATAKPIIVQASGVQDAIIALGAMVILLVALVARAGRGKRKTPVLDRVEGFLFVSLYAAYIVFIVVRG